jgi:hypothetical protein
MKRTALTFAFAAFALTLPAFALAATMSVVPSATSVSTGDIVTVRVTVNPQGTAVNNAEAVLHFPAGILEALSISKAGSVFPLWVEDPNFSNAAGTVSFNGGVPNPGVSNAGTVISISFHALRAGTASLSLSDAAVRANDGMGTDVLSGTYGTQIAISTPVVTPVAVPSPTNPSPANPSPAPGPSAGPLVIQSSTHPDQTLWYANTSPKFSWNLPPKTTAIQLGIDQSATAVPSVNYTNAIESKTIDSLESGTWYFRLRYKVAGIWSAISTYKVNIDATAPLITSHDFVYDAVQDAVQIDIGGTDTGSGVVAYDASIDGGAPVRIAAVKSTDSLQSFTVPLDKNSKSGIHRIAVRAIDAAGNIASVEGSFSIPPSLRSQILFHIGSFGVSLLAALIAMILFSICSLALAVFAWEMLLLSRQRRRPELPLVKKSMHRSFLKMKTNMEMDVRALDRVRTKRDLSREETALYRRLLENMNTLEKTVDKQLDDLA